MNIIDQWVISRAEKIKAKAEAIKKAERKAEVNQYEFNRNLENKAKEILYRALDPIVQKMENEPCHIKEGDVAILNKYGMLHRFCHNGWDGGPNSFLTHCKPEDKNSPVKCDIGSIYVDRSLAHEKIERWIDNHFSRLESLIETNTLALAYFNWFDHLTPVDTTFKQTYGLYKTAKFTPIFSEFRPQWGLNVGSFLEISTSEAKETHTIWLEEISLDFAYQQLKEQTNKIETRKREIDKQYRNITYLN